MVEVGSFVSELRLSTPEVAQSNRIPDSDRVYLCRVFRRTSSACNESLLIPIVLDNSTSTKTMGCLVSTPAEADKEAAQRNARIDRNLKNDKKTLDRTIKILLLGG